MRYKKMFVAIAFFAMICFSAPVFSQGVVSFSFASDDHHSGPTFQYVQETRQILGKGIYELIVDLNDHGVGGSVTFLSQFSFEGTIYDYLVIPFGSGYVHHWRLYGKMLFLHHNAPGNPAILAAEYSDLLLTSWSPVKEMCGPTLTMQVSKKVDPKLFMKPGPVLVNNGVKEFTGLENFAFTLTNLKKNEMIPVIARNGEFRTNWKAEGSFSGSGQRRVEEQPNDGGESIETEVPSPVNE